MSGSPHFADNAWHGAVTLEENVRLARDTYRARLHCPELARRIVPGQFLMLRLAGYDDPLLGRPLALYDTVCDAAGNPVGVDVVYLVIGKMTSRLARYRGGEQLEIWGPLGNGFSAAPVDELIMVAGGIGQTPFLALAREFTGERKFGGRVVQKSKSVTLCYGVRNREYLAGVEDFEALGVDVRISTDDGSAGHAGFVTDLLKERLATHAQGTRRVACCGPEPMMAAVAEICRTAGVECQVSLETPMACGIGICFSCVAPVRDAEGGWDYRRTCVEGPVFDGQRIAFDA